MKEIKNIIYIAGVVTDNYELLALVNNQYSNKFCHHMTIKYGNIVKFPENLGQEFNFVVQSLVYDKNAIAVTGYPDDEEIEKFMQLNNQIPHITICTADGIKPVYSNTLIKIGNYQPLNLTVPMKVGAFVAYTDNTTGWIF